MGLSLTILILGSMLSSIPASAVVATNPTPDCSAGTTCTITFTYTGDYYSWTVPSGITSITVDAYGAEGGRSNFRANTAVPGKGGRVQATLNTTSGEALHIYVGGAGSSVTSISANSASAGWNGGGRGGFGNGSGYWGAGGGGATDIRTTAGLLSTRILVAGGGGGTACNGCSENGGDGGGLSGAPGANTPNGDTGPAGGGTQVAGGRGATYSGWGPAQAGAQGLGGNAQANESTASSATLSGGGGGGGGYFGGGGGSWVGGGGGSSFTDAVRGSSVTHTQGARTGNGTLSITYLNSPQPTTFSTSQSSPTNISAATTVTYSLILSQSVSDLTASDFQFGGTSTCNTPGLSGSTTTYTVTVTNCTEGALILQLKANSITGTSTGPVSISSANTVVIDRTAPTISSVTAPSNATYKPADTPTFTVAFSESITVTGTPRLTLTVGSTTEYANFVSLTDSRTALFRYTVASDPVEFDTDGITLATSLDLNSGTIRDLATNAMTNASLTAPTLSSVLVAQPPAAPTVDSITATSGTLTVYFTAGAARGSTTSNYQFSTNNGGAWSTRSPVATTSPLVISGLNNGQGYQVRLRAISNAGTSDSSTVVNETPTAVSVAGDSTLILTYGSSASTSAYSATGGTSTYTWSLGSSLTGITLSGTTVTASSSTPAGTYSQSVRATDGNLQVGTRSLTITVNKASTTITIALPNSATSAALGGAVTITATVPRAGAVNFRLGGSTISGCGSAAAATTTATCSWTPASLGSVSLTAIFTPTDTSNFETSTSTTLSITVVNGVSTVTLSLAGGTTTPPKGQAINIIAAVDQAGRITFFVDGKRVPGCINRAASVGNINCSWKPAVQKVSVITASLNPTNSVYNNSTSSLRVQVIRRTGTRG
ncbi:unannotated protein [freshwater metagenome]|uniref:receptor protein-tyrosine kinase n=1 Tax=freshwater metagenome TaxID=449393 RepID=A0A6J5YU24_9ZZZZ